MYRCVNFAAGSRQGFGAVAALDMRTRVSKIGVEDRNYSVVLSHLTRERGGSTWFYKHPSGTEPLLRGAASRQLAAAEPRTHARD